MAAQHDAQRGLRRRPPIAATLLAAVALLSTPSASRATDWHVAAAATGNGSVEAPFGRLQDALNAAQPGDTIHVGPGTYAEGLRSVRHGLPEAPVTIRARVAREAIVTTPGTVLRVDHAYHVFEGLVFDGQYGAADAVILRDGARGFVLRDVEVRRSGRDCIDIRAPQGGLIDGALVHHCLWWDGGRLDAHGIVAGAVRDLAIRNTEIHTFSGDGVQVDPGRSAPGWGGVVIESCRIWLAPLETMENGIPAGVVPGENAVDTKASAALPRSSLLVRDVVAHGFRGAISNQAAFNLKEHVEARVDRVTVSRSEIAFRLRGGGSSPGGALVTVTNAVVHDVAVGIRYEDNIQDLKVWNSTFGRNVGAPFYAASSGGSVLDVRNVLVVGRRLPAQASGASNLAVGEGTFAGAGAGDYRLAAGSPAIDAGVAIPGVTWDRDGRGRPCGPAYDVGAYEFASGSSCAAPAPPRNVRVVGW